MHNLKKHILTLTSQYASFYLESWSVPYPVHLSALLASLLEPLLPWCELNMLNVRCMMLYVRCMCVTCAEIAGARVKTGRSGLTCLMTFRRRAEQAKQSCEASMLDTKPPRTFLQHPKTNHFMHHFNRQKLSVFNFKLTAWTRTRMLDEADSIPVSN